MRPTIEGDPPKRDCHSSCEMTTAAGPVASVAEQRAADPGGDAQHGEEILRHHRAFETFGTPPPVRFIEVGVKAATPEKPCAPATRSR